MLTSAQILQSTIISAELERFEGHRTSLKHQIYEIVNLLWLGLPRCRS